MRKHRRQPSAKGWALLGLGMLCLLATCDWLSAQSKRLYPDDPGALARRSGLVEERFPIHGNEVVPTLDSRENARFVFSLNASAPRRLRYDVQPGNTASYKIFFQHDGERRLLISEKVKRAGSREISVPRQAGELEFVTRGSLTWLDLRLDRPIFLWPAYLIIGVGLMWLFWQTPGAKFRRWSEWLLFLATLLICLVVAEWILRQWSAKFAPALLAARSELGLVGEDSRLLDPQRYKIRLRPNLDAHYEWRLGDIARLHFIPNEVSPQVDHRYVIRTDAEGFRNDRLRDKFQIAAVGDSFTDGATGPADEAWPSRLAQRTGQEVQNYGISSFGPQQELYVLRDFVLRHRPSVVVLAFFGGNDLSDAETFDLWEKNPARPIEERPGWRLNERFRRYETLYLWTAGRTVWEQIFSPTGGGLTTATKPFDRGMFSVRRANHILRFAFFPPYLEKLARPRAEIEQSRGWALARTALQQMHADCARQGIKFVFMYIPEKSKVYWSLTTAALNEKELQSALKFYGQAKEKPPRVQDIDANHLAQNALLRDFCAQEHIPMLDLTTPLQNAVEDGIETYFPDDTHWNAAGHDLAARELAKFLAQLP